MRNGGQLRDAAGVFFSHTGQEQMAEASSLCGKIGD